jgi:hypothetical protein
MTGKLPFILTGDTFKQTWVSSGATASLISAAVISGSETVVSSGTGTSSGNGHYYRTAIINTPGYYVQEWKATIAGNPQKRRQRFKVGLNEVD